MPSPSTRSADTRPTDATEPPSDDPLSTSPRPGSGPGIELPVDVDPAADIADADVDWLADRLADAVDRLGLRRGRLGVAVLGDDEIARLHETYKHQPGPTDVLTFDLSEAEGESPADTIDGDIAIGWDEARRRADELGHPVRHEALLYVVHGLMHLLGEDDHDDADAARMHGRENELLEAMGVGAVYGPIVGEAQGRPGGASS